MPSSRPVPPGVSGASSERWSLAAAFERGLDQQDRLCRELEDMADRLPGRLDTHQAVLAVGGLRVWLRRAHLVEEALVFPSLVAVRRDLVPVLRHLVTVHAEDEDQASDLEDALTTFEVSGNRANAEQLGYMMRGLFVALRRHVAFERDHLRPLLGEPGPDHRAGTS